MNTRPTIIGIAGSLRKGSSNAALLRAAAEAAPSTVHVEIASIRGIPLFDADLESSEGVPEAVQQLKDRIAASAGLLIVTPEYNNSLPGVFKNAVDWLTRPPQDIRRVFGNRPVALMGATPGPFGTILAQSAWIPVLRALGTRPWFGARMYVGNAGSVFDAEGHLADADIRGRLESFMAGFADFVVGGG